MLDSIIWFITSIVVILWLFCPVLDQLANTIIKIIERSRKIKNTEDKKEKGKDDD